ncbi:hypothetical protein AB3S75_017539 [Citrus x aurantiifolia]
MQEAICPVCRSGWENIVHALVDCKIARKVWKNSPLGCVLQGANFPDVIILLHSAHFQQKNMSSELVASLLWIIWSARNNLIFKGKYDDPMILLAKAVTVAESVKRIKKPEEEFLAEQNNDQQSQWSPPEEGWLKVNVDAAMDGVNYLAGLGAVVKNHKGVTIAAAVSTVKSSGDVELSEAKAVLWGMQAAVKAGATSIILESDSTGVIELINNKRSTLTETFWVIFDILETKKIFQNFKAQHVPRMCNFLAHDLAKLALKKSDPCIWLDEFPEDVLFLFS